MCELCLPVFVVLLRSRLRNESQCGLDGDQEQRRRQNNDISRPVLHSRKWKRKQYLTDTKKMKLVDVASIPTLLHVPEFSV